jgi:hypothetical protein
MQRVQLSSPPSSPTPAIARAVAQIQAIIASDPRFGELLDRFGSVYEYVHDHGMGRVLVAVSQREGGVRTRKRSPHSASPRRADT